MSPPPGDDGPRPLSQRLRPELFFVGSAVFHYLGPAFAVLLFARVDPLGVAWLRILSAAAVFAIWRRPWTAWSIAPPAERRTIIIWGTLLALMNASFYLAIDQLPLGTVAAIEFAGPVLLAALGARSIRNLAALALAITGVLALAEVSFSGSPLGFGFALVNMILFTGYIIVAHRVSRHDCLAGIDGLAMAMLIASAFALPIGVADAAPAFTDPVALGAAIGVGITSSVVPYVFDQLAMRRLARATYALMIALLPATAIVIGILVLTQIPTTIELVGVGIVIAAVALHRDQGSLPPTRRRAARRARPPFGMLCDPGVQADVTTLAGGGTATAHEARTPPDDGSGERSNPVRRVGGEGLEPPASSV